MKYETYIPCDELKPFVKSFAIQESTTKGPAGFCLIRDW